jgi:flagellar protein FliO/FliZ
VNRSLAIMFGVAAVPLNAAESAGSTVTSAGALQAILGFAAVLVVMAALAWLVRRFGLGRTMNNSPVKIVGGVSVGGRERVLVVEAGDQWIVLGVAPGRVNALTTIPRQESLTKGRNASDHPRFLAQLQQSIETRNDE